MAEMSTLLGYEIVDKKARELIANLGGGGTGEGSLLKTIHLDSGESASISDFISGTPIIGMRMLGTTIAQDFESEETLYNPRTITSGGSSWENSAANTVQWNANSGSTNLSGVVFLPGVTNGFFGIPVSEEYAKDYETLSGTNAGRVSTKNAYHYKDSKGQCWIGDEVDMETGIYHQRINKFVFDGSDDEIITKVSTDDNHWTYQIQLPSENLYPFNRYNNEGFICDRLPHGLTSANNGIENSGIIMTHGGFVANIGYYMSENTVDEFRRILGQYPIAVYYVLPMVDSKKLLLNIDNEQRMHTYRIARYGRDSVKNYGAYAAVGQMLEFSYATDSAGLAVALGTREFEHATHYESLMDKLYLHFGCDRSEYPNCMIVMPKSVSVTSYSVFRFYFHKYDIHEIDYEGLNSSNDKIYIGHYGIVKVLPSDTVLPDDLNDVGAVIDFVVSNFTKDDLVYYSSSSHYDADTNNYVYYSNYALSVVPVTEIDIPVDGDVKFPKASPGKNPAHGSKGQLLTSEGNGSIGFTTLPPAKTYEDILYDHFRVSKHKYPYIHMGISGQTNNAFIFFASQLEETDWCYYTMSGKYMSAAIPRTSELLSGMCYDLDRVVNYIVTNMEWNALSDPIRGTYSLNSIIPYRGHYGWHYLNINVHENTMHYDLRQQPLLTTERGVRFTYGLKNGHNVTPYYYGEAGQYMITNGDGTVSFADGAGSGGASVELTDDLNTDDSNVALSAKGGKLLQEQINDISKYVKTASADQIYEAAGLSVTDYPYLSVMVNENRYMNICFSPTISAKGDNKIQFDSPIRLFESGEPITIDDLTNLKAIRDKAVEVTSSDSPSTSGTYSVTYGVEDAYYYTNFNPVDYGVTITGNHWTFSSGSGTDVTVPTKVSELENDAGYITADDLGDVEFDNLVPNTRTIAGIDLSDDISKEELRNALEICNGTAMPGELKPWVYNTNGEEVVVGVYNGKPVYRKYFTLDVVTTNGLDNKHKISDYVTDYERIVNHKMYTASGNILNEIHAQQSQSNDQSWICYFVNVGLDLILITCSETRPALDYTFTCMMEYTKTTDAEGSGDNMTPYGIYSATKVSGELKPWLYSTEEEVVVGVYKGKPLYRKCYDITGVALTADKFYVHPTGLSNVERYVSVNGALVNDSNISASSLPQEKHTDVQGITLLVNESLGGIHISASKDNALNENVHWLITLEYTKTTDAEGSGNGLTPYGIYDSKIDDIVSRLTALENIDIAEGGAF